MEHNLAIEGVIQERCDHYGRKVGICPSHRQQSLHSSVAVDPSHFVVVRFSEQCYTLLEHSYQQLSHVE